ncbi:drug/metabolite transporter (DMT)-like permease [Maribacter spongiicola]|uniref:Drug/metabolite transporter (DMT)-like permease n=1 Tax=Maribacter spongiicola TaxID=1206753 RepID=A0A4R7KCM8_9FLAO|nr:DMT family transporter [Maribacter spongiicola]TDT50446.1 drug/metabolite transporter (DMT)-like permease [Maribacter spongiicola]
MQKDRIHNLLHLHFIVFIWGFTAILGKLITIDSLPLVWIRMGLATLFIAIYILLAKFSLKVSRKTFYCLVGGGIVVALHWVTFFLAIKVSTVSVALAMMSTGAFFTALMEPFWYKRKIIGYEIVFGLMVVAGLYLIFKVETEYIYGMVIALISAFLAAIFSLINGKLVQNHKPSVISFYELGVGMVFLSVLLLMKGDFNMSLITLPQTDWVYLIILALICTAYAFIASVKIMRVLTPYTVMLTTNLEPVYGILLAWLIFGSEEKMKPMFYVGALIILSTVIANGILKQRANIKKRVPKI